MRMDATSIKIENQSLLSARRKRASATGKSALSLAEPTDFTCLGSQLSGQSSAGLIDDTANSYEGQLVTYLIIPLIGVVIPSGDSHCQISSIAGIVALSLAVCTVPCSILSIACLTLGP